MPLIEGVMVSPRGIRFVAWAGIALGVLAAGCAERYPSPVPIDHELALKIRKDLGDAGAAAGATAESTAPAGTGWATLKGVFKYDGPPPAMKLLTVDKDVEVCSRGGHQMFDRALEVDSATGGIKNVLLYVRKTKRVHESAQAAPAREILFDQAKCEFLNRLTIIQVGQTLKIKNSDPVGHNTNITGKASAGANLTIPAGESGSFKPTAEESLPQLVTCNIHPWMKAYWIPRKNAYCAVTQADGSFEIANLPAGEDVEFQVWHEAATGAQGALALDNKDLKWNTKGRFTVRLAEDETRELDLTVPAAALGGG